MGTIIEFYDPVLVIDRPDADIQISVMCSSIGAYLLIDTPNGEVRLRIKEDEWKRLQDAVWMAQRNLNKFDLSEDRDAD